MSRFAFPLIQFGPHHHHVQDVDDGIVLDPLQRRDALHPLGDRNDIFPRLAGVGALDDAGLGQHEHVVGGLAEDRAELTIPDGADLGPRLAFVLGRDQGAFDNPVERVLMPARQRLGMVVAARVERLALVGGAQKTRLGSGFRFGLCDDGGLVVEDPGGAITFADVVKRFASIGGLQQQVARLVLEREHEAHV